MEQDLKDVEATEARLSQQAATLGPAGQRADRDFRKQTIMTIRTLLVLPSRYGRIIIPAIVVAELQHQRAPETVRNWIEARPDWIDMQQPV